MYRIFALDQLPTVLLLGEVRQQQSLQLLLISSWFAKNGCISWKKYKIMVIVSLYKQTRVNKILNRTVMKYVQLQAKSSCYSEEKNETHVSVKPWKN